MGGIQYGRDLALQHDMQAMLRRETLRAAQRRRLLGLMATGGAAAALAACASRTAAGPAALAACMASPEETEGPFPADGSNRAHPMGGGAVVNVLAQSGVVRSDIRKSFGSATGTAAGVPVTLTVTVVNVAKRCAPLAGYAVYVWQCDRDGNYSLYDGGARGENYLRGVQVTDGSGQATFTTVFPACYMGRWPHIHFEVYDSLDSATSYRNKLLTSQMAMPADLCRTVYDTAGYGGSRALFDAVSVASDMVFGDSTAEELAWQTPRFKGDPVQGYTTAIRVGLSA
ncbi:MAG: intradiol ring-cleavage dioxygenase [Acidovorax sp.]